LDGVVNHHPLKEPAAAAAAEAKEEEEEHVDIERVLLL
jgi:hypothetical protein